GAGLAGPDVVGPAIVVVVGVVGGAVVAGTDGAGEGAGVVGAVVPITMRRLPEKRPLLAVTRTSPASAPGAREGHRPGATTMLHTTRYSTAAPFLACRKIVSSAPTSARSPNGPPKREWCPSSTTVPAWPGWVLPGRCAGAPRMFVVLSP